MSVNFNIQELPQEIIIQCFSHLSASELCKVERVCKQFQEMSNDDFLWNRLHASEFSHLTIHPLEENQSIKDAVKIAFRTEESKYNFYKLVSKFYQDHASRFPQ